MNDFSDLFFTMFSIVIFSMLLLQANQAIFQNNVVMVDHEYEKTAISLAQSLIDEARKTAYDEAVLDGDVPQNVNPGDVFSPNSELGPPAGVTRPDFTVFDYYNGYTDTIHTDLGPFVMNVTVNYVIGDPPYGQSGEQTFSKLLEAEVRSLHADRSVRLNYLKTYF